MPHSRVAAQSVRERSPPISRIAGMRRARVRDMRSTAFLLVVSLGFGGCHIEDDMLVFNRPGLARAAAGAQQRMHTRFAAASRIQQAIAFGDLERVRAEARDIAALDESEVSLTWQPYFDSVRDAAHQVELSESVLDAARLTAILGQRCANCHVAIGARVAFPVESRPPDGPKLAVQMPGHQWAAAQMWYGLIGPSDERWVAGARALTTIRLTSVAQSATPASELDLDDLARIRLYANRALTARPQDARADLFGTLLTTCTHCHAVLRDR
jgi:hypothetical protein